MTNETYENTTTFARIGDDEITTLKPLSKSLSAGGIAGVVIGVLVGLVLIILAFVYFCRRSRSDDSTTILPPKPKPTTAQSAPKPSAAAPPANPTPLSPLGSPCPKAVCQDFLAKLKLPSAYFDEKHDRCYCKKCHQPKTRPRECEVWCTNLHGWTRFGLHPHDAHKKGWNAMKTWDTTYYGTAPNKLSSIVNTRSIPLDGDQLLDGTRFSSGHPDPTVCTTSPSLIFASQSQFTKRWKFTGSDGKNHKLQVVVLCKQKPGTAVIEGEQWTTKSRGTIIPYGLVMRLL